MNTTFTFRTDEYVKTQSSQICKEMGLDLSTAINMFLKAIIREKKLPILVSEEVDIDPIKTYPDYFFSLGGSIKGLGFEEEPEDTIPDDEDFKI